MSPSDRADAWNEANPVGGENEDEDGGKEPKRALDQVPADDALEQTEEAFHEPFQKVLRAAGNLRHASRCHLGEHDEAHGDDPRHDHGVRDRKAEGPRDLDGVLRQAVFHRFQKTEAEKVDHVHPDAVQPQHGACHDVHQPSPTAPALNPRRAAAVSQNRPPAFRICSAMSESEPGGFRIDRGWPGWGPIVRLSPDPRISGQVPNPGGPSTRARHGPARPLVREVLPH